MRFVFSNIEFLFFSDLSEARYIVDKLHSGCPPAVRLHSIFGDLPEGNMGILPFWAFYVMDLPWTWTNKKLPLAERMKNHDSQFLGFSTKLKKHKYHSRQHEIDSFYAMHHGFRFCFMGGTQMWKLFQETFIPFLSSWPPYSCRKTLIGFLPFQMEFAEKTDSQKLWSPRYLLDYGG
jgi:hypothetical protein